MNTNFNILITSPPHRENLVAEIWLEDELLAEINQEQEVLQVEFSSNSKFLKLPLDEFIDTLTRAKSKLLNIQS